MFRADMDALPVKEKAFNGAAAMVADGLYPKVPAPSVVFAAQLKLSLRWYSRQARDQMIEMVRQVTDAIAVGNGMPADRMPPYVNRHPKFQVELPAIAASVKANAAVLLVLLAK